MQVTIAIEILGWEFAVRVEGEYHRGFPGNRMEPREPDEFAINEAWAALASNQPEELSDWYCMPPGEISFFLEEDEENYEKILTEVGETQDDGD